MLNLFKVILVSTAIVSGGLFDFKFIGIPIIWLAVIVFYECLRDGGLEIVKNIYAWIIRFFAHPIISHYEAREKNYKDVIKKLDAQLYKNKDQSLHRSSQRVRGIMETPEEFDLYNEVISYTGSLWYKDK